MAPYDARGARPRRALAGAAGASHIGAVEPIGRILVWTGALLLVLGLLLTFGPGLPWLGRLPGDIRIERPGLRIFFPVTTCLLLSGVVSGVLWLVSRLR